MPTKSRRKSAAASTGGGSKTSRYFLMRGLLHAFYWMDESMQSHLQAAGLSAISRSQSMIMSNIADGVTRPADLARRLGISRQAVQQLLADMQDRELIDLVRDPSDARAKIVRFSLRGRNLGEISIRALEHIDRVIEQRIGREALNELRRLLVDTDWGDPVTVTAAEMNQSKRRKGPTLDTVIRRVRVAS